MAKSMALTPKQERHLEHISKTLRSDFRDSARSYGYDDKNIVLWADHADQYLRANPHLMNCHNLRPVMREALIKGLMLGDMACIVAYGQEADLQIDYATYREMARIAGWELHCHVGHENDSIDISLGHIEYHFNWKNPGPIVGVLLSARDTRTQELQWAWRSRQECEAVRDQRSAGWRAVRNNPEKAKQHPWHPDNPGFPAMLRKTVLRQAEREALFQTANLLTGQVVRPVSDFEEEQEMIEVSSVTPVGGDKSGDDVEAQAEVLFSSEQPQEEADLDEQLWAKLKGCTTITACQEEADSFVADAPEQADALRQVMEARIAEIRAGRGEKANDA